MIHICFIKDIFFFIPCYFTIFSTKKQYNRRVPDKLVHGKKSPRTKTNVYIA